MRLVKHILKSKGYDIHSTTMDATVFDAIKTMSDKNVGALLVIECGNYSPAPTGFGNPVVPRPDAAIPGAGGLDLRPRGVQAERGEW